MKDKRSASSLPLKSIWETSLVKDVFRELNAAVKHSYRLWNYLIKHPSTPLQEVPYDSWMCSKKASRVLQEEYTLYTTKIVQKEVSSREDTVKLIIELQDGHRVETVVIQHRKHATVCVSSQVGCQMGCKFCATGTMGIIGDLTAGEIIEQVIHANTITKIRNVVFMGMGEPLNNYENVKDAVEFLIDTRTLGLSPRHVTISTVGVIHTMKRLTLDLPTVNMALSLHAPNQEIRLKIVPAAKAHKFEKLMDALDYHIEHSHHKSKKFFLRATTVMIEYILIKDVNDRPEHAHELGRLLGPRRQHILLNLIPYNPTDVAEDFVPPTQEDVDTFFDIITSEEYGVYCRVRQEMGQDIDGACGQLALKSKAEKAQELLDSKVDIEEISNTNIKKNPDRNGSTVKKLKVSEKSNNHQNDGSTSSDGGKVKKDDGWSFQKALSNPVIAFPFIVFSTISCILFCRRRWAFSRK